LHFGQSPGFSDDDCPSASALRLPFALLLACTSRSQEDRVAAPEALRSELLTMAEGDRAAIEASLKPDLDRRKLKDEHLKRTQRLKEIIRRVGWPTISLVGKEGASAAWIVVQHADDDVQFQRECVALLEAAALKGEAETRHMACLTDRVLTATGRTQKYGTQGAGGPAADWPGIDERRKAIGLAPLEVYWRSLKEGVGVTTCRR
jgi:hypothetical protein